MKKTLCAGAFLLLAALACHRNPKPDFAWDHAATFSPLKTYAWYVDPTWVMPGGNSIVDGQFIDRNVRQAVDQNLQKKGIEKSEDGRADIYVSYSTNPAGVLSQDKYGVYTWWNYAYVGYSGTKYQKQGTLTLDIRNHDNKLIWRGARTALVGTNPEELRGDISRAVALLLSDFPPPAGKAAN